MLKIQIMDMLLPWLLKTGRKLLITVLTPSLAIRSSAP